MWIDTITGAIRLTHSDIRQSVSNVSFPSVITDEMIAAHGFAPVTQVTPTFSSATQKATQIAPVQVEGIWTQQWSVTALTAPEIEAKRVSAIPASVSPRQIRQALSAVGLRTGVEAAVAASDQDTKDWYAYITTFERNHAMVAAMGVALGVSVLDLDNLWTLARTL